MKIFTEGENIAAVVNLNQLDDIISVLTNVTKDDFDADEDILNVIIESRNSLSRLIRQLSN
jgi:hypothetical protein